VALSAKDLQFAICEPGARNLHDYAKTSEEAEAKAHKLRDERGKPFVVEPFDDFSARVTRAWLDDTPLREITGDFYDEMLCVLPPMYRQGAMGFFMCEFTAGSVTNQFVMQRRGDFLEPRYFMAAVDICDRSTWITPEKIAALPHAPRLEWFNREEGAESV
jgi:hypothetical protein